MSIRYTHTNIVTTDWQRLARFYQQVFDCRLAPPPRDQAGEWLDRGIGVRDAHLQGVHLKLPGHGSRGPTLEIYQHRIVESCPRPTANQRGLRHLAFHVDDVAAMRDAVVANGGAEVGEIVSTTVEGVGELTFTYVADPDGNIIELQNWS